MAVVNLGSPRSLLRTGLLLLGTALLVVGSLAASQYRKATAFGPLFVEPFSLAVDQAENLYCGVEFERVHKYSPEGEMIGAWSVDAGLQPFRLRTGPDATIEVATANGKLIRFDDVGKTISSQADSGAFERFGAANDLEVETPSGVRYAIEEGALVRSLAAERGELHEGQLWKPAPGLPLRWIRSPVPLALLLVSGPLVMLASIAISRSRGGAEGRNGSAH